MKAVNRIAKRIFTLFFRDRSAIFTLFGNGYHDCCVSVFPGQSVLF